jgi:hypothetical protein
MLKTSDEIRKEQLDACPRLSRERIILFDSNWLLPTPDELLEAVKINSVKDIPTVVVPETGGEQSRCEEYAIHLLSAVRKWRTYAIDRGEIPKEKQLNWALGISCGYLYSITIHVINICNTTDGLYFVDGRKDEVFKLDISKYDPFFSLML